MNNEFTREERYIVFKLSDVERYLTAADRSHLAMMKNEIDAGRDCANKPPFNGGVPVTPTVKLRRTARRGAKLGSLYRLSPAGGSL